MAGSLEAGEDSQHASRQSSNHACQHLHSLLIKNAISLLLNPYTNNVEVPKTAVLCTATWGWLHICSVPKGPEINMWAWYKNGFGLYSPVSWQLHWGFCCISQRRDGEKEIRHRRLTEAEFSQRVNWTKKPHIDTSNVGACRCWLACG